MFALLITAAAASLTPTLELAPRNMDVEGVRATYTRTVDADGTIHLKGFYKNGGRQRFHYVVKGDQVDGQVDGVSLTFRHPRAR